MKGSFKKNLVKSRFKWAGQVERMGDEKPAEMRCGGGVGGGGRGKEEAD